MRSLVLDMIGAVRVLATAQEAGFALQPAKGGRWRLFAPGGRLVRRYATSGKALAALDRMLFGRGEEA